MAVLSDLSRPFGIAFGWFTIVNLPLALQQPKLSVTHIWLDAYMPEPTLSVFAAILGVALVLPHRMGETPAARSVLAGIFAGFSILVAAKAIQFYLQLYSGRISTDFPVPLAAVLTVIILVELARVFWWRRAENKLPAPASFFFKSLSTGLAFVLIVVVYIVSFGHTDFRRRADAAVILGAKVYADGEPCAALRDRLDTGIEVYRAGLVDYLIMTGARDPNGHEEPAVMARYAVENGVDPGHIILDYNGLNTRASAVHCGDIARQWGFKSLLAVTQYFHCARVKLAFDRERTSVHTVPTCSGGSERPMGPIKLSRETFYLFREAVAFPFYWLFHH